MVELEDLDANGFGLWLDGNMPSSYGTLPYLTSRRYLLESGFRPDVLRKYNLYSTRWKARATKDRLFEAVLAALAENTCKSQDESYTADFDMYILNPASKQGTGGKPLLLGPHPSNARRRSTYRQIILIGDSSTTTKIKETNRILQDVLRFSPAPIETYHYPDEFCEEAITLLRLIKGLDPTACAEHLIETGYKVGDFHWRPNHGPFSAVSGTSQRMP